MKKCVFAISLFALCLALMIPTVVPVNAATSFEIVPYWDNTDQFTFNFEVYAPGTAYVEATYAAKAEVFTQAKITVKIQKRFLGVFWKTVDIGEPNKEWVAYSNAVSGVFQNSFAVDGTGTYRAVFTLEIFSSGGTTDVIEDTMETKYS